MGQHRAAGHAQRGDRGVDVAQPGVAVAVDGPVGAVRDGQQAGVIRRRQRPDEPEPVRLHKRVVVAAVLPGVIDHGQRLHPGDQVPIAGHQLVDHGGELADVRPVTGIGVGDHRHPPPVSTSANPTSRRSVRFCLALPRRDQRARCRCRCRWRSWSCPAPARSGRAELGHHRPADAGLDHPQLGLAEAVHRIPEPAMIQRGPIRFTHRPPAVVSHQSAKPCLEHGSTIRFAHANAR